MNTFSSTPSLLHLEGFDGASRRNRPNLVKGSTVFAYVSSNNNAGDMPALLTCKSPLDPNGVGGKKDWMTGEAMYGPLKGGVLVPNLPVGYPPRLVDGRFGLLESISRANNKGLGFEVVSGANGAVWIRAQDAKTTAAIAGCVQGAAGLKPEDREGMVREAAKWIQNGGGEGA